MTTARSTDRSTKVVERGVRFQQQQVLLVQTSTLNHVRKDHQLQQEAFWPWPRFTMCAVHGVAMGLGVSLYYKFFMGDPDTRAIKQYYEENPPR
ncbi:unnamed protein product [Cylindrotheca closterium]|uniref:Uncharacterized protein n=1 Tax=Cylindrotheca closterium TaxID=2856 RepID=A0AAD2FUQ2_9STRA|nr:unnamed protein product [Cylindrotheca closterium]